MALKHEFAHSAGVHTCHTPDCMKFVTLLLTWHSNSYKRHPLHTNPHTSIKYLEGGGWVKGKG
jgi:hypothetical protein